MPTPLLSLFMLSACVGGGPRGGPGAGGAAPPAPAPTFSSPFASVVLDSPPPAFVTGCPNESNSTFAVVEGGGPIGAGDDGFGGSFAIPRGGRPGGGPTGTTTPFGGCLWW